jgi:hypothetical protein
VTSCFLCVAFTHFNTTLVKQNQPHTLTIHLEFPRRTEIGPATFTVKDVKLGRQTSTIHVTLSQDGRDEVLAYITQSNIAQETGVSFDTGWAPNPAPYPHLDLAGLKDGTDPFWAEQTTIPFPAFRKATNRVRFFFPRAGQKLRSLGDHWLLFRNGERFTQHSLGFVADMFPQIVEAFTQASDPYHVTDAFTGEKKPLARFWYPTVVLNLDIKKALPEEGVEWLFVRNRSKMIKNGRLDIEVVILDQWGELVALSHHVTLVLGVERNMAERSRKDGGENGGRSKI